MASSRTTPDPTVRSSAPVGPSAHGYGWLWFLVPPTAGVACALVANTLLTDEWTLSSVWPGASLDPDNAPGFWLMRGICVGAAIIVWVAAALALSRRDPVQGGNLVTSMRRVAPGFAAFMSILVLNAAERYGASQVMYWSVLAGIYSLAFLAAWLVAVARSGRGGLPEKPGSTPGRPAALAVMILVLGYVAVSGAMAYLQYDAVRIGYRDNSCFEEMMWRTLHGEFLRSTLFGDGSFFGQHFEFIQLLLLPVYMIWPGIKALMLSQSILLALGAVPLYLLAVRKLDSRVAAILFSAAYLLYAPMQYVDKRLSYGTFIPEAIAIPALLWVLYFLDSGNMWGLLASGLVAAACKEDMVLPVAMTGIVLMWRGRWRWGLPILLGGFTWFLAALLVIIPHFAGSQSHVLDCYADMGGSVGQIVRTVAGDPVYALKHFFAFTRTEFLLMMLVPMGCLAILSPTAVLIFLPSIASNNLASWQPSTTIYYHYHISLVPFAVGGAVMGAANLVRELPLVNWLWRETPEAARPRVVALFCGVLVFAAALGGDVAYGKFPLSTRFYDPYSPAYWRHIYVQSERAKYALSMVEPSIPKDAKVSASQYLATLFTHRAAVYLYPDGLQEADYVVLEHDEPDYFSTRYSVSGVLNDRSDVQGFELVSDEKGIYVFKRGT